MSVIDPIALRRSPRALDPSSEVAAADLVALIEAARLAPSSRNRQPWEFLVGMRGDATFEQLLSSLYLPNRQWAKNAGALVGVLVVGEPTAGDSGVGEPGYLDAGRAYDVGLAMGQFGVQAVAMGLATHQMGGFDRAVVSREFVLPPHVAPMVVVAVGRTGDPAALPPELRSRENAPRPRRSLAELIHVNRYGSAGNIA